MNERLSIKALASELGRGRGYVSAMRALGFAMPGGTATLAEAIKWLSDHPGFNREAVYPTKKRPPEQTGTFRNAA